MSPSIFRTELLSLVALLVGAPVLGATPTRASDHPETAAGHHAAHAGCPLEATSAAAGALPQQVGQDAFAALREMGDLLTADPATDWSVVDLDALREHLVDMNRVVLHAAVTVRPVPGGFEARVTGAGRTLDAIRRMVPAHARFMDGRDGLRVQVSAAVSDGAAEDGLVVRVTTADPSAVARLRGLGFFGFLAAGDHHRPHHRAMALGTGHPY